jgi:hypothetical protein
MFDELETGAPSHPRDEHLEAPQGTRLDAVTNARPVDLAADEACLLEHFEVLGHRRLRERKLFYNVATDARVPPSQDS